jgi:hypothetical protein
VAAIVKNTGTEITMHDEALDTSFAIGRKCGTIMGDYSRTAINNFAEFRSIIGVCCNIFGEGLAPKTMKDFSWACIIQPIIKLKKRLNISATGKNERTRIIFC